MKWNNAICEGILKMHTQITCKISQVTQYFDKKAKHFKFAMMGKSVSAENKSSKHDISEGF